MSISVFDNPLFSIFADEEFSDLFAPQHTLAAFNRVEAALAAALAQEGIISAADEAAILAAIEAYQPDWPALVAAGKRDGLPVPGYVKKVRATLGEAHRKSFHFGSTSQDIMDTALALTLCEVNTRLASRLAAVLSALDAIEAKWGDGPLMGRTRMQAALPINVGARLRNWIAPLRRQQQQFPAVRKDAEVVQMGGPVGTREAWGEKAPAVVRHVSNALALGDPGASWHTARDGVLGYGAWLSITSQSLGKIGADIALMAQQGLDEIAIEGAGGSSAMPHKQNPVQAELLVTLASFNATSVGGLHQSGVHEQERSGIAWALEWMILPQMCLTTGRGLVATESLLASIARIGKP